MNVKQTTKQLLVNIRGKLYEEIGYQDIITDKQIADLIGINKMTFSRLINEKTEPKIETWYKILDTHRKILGEKRTKKILEQCV